MSSSTVVRVSIRALVDVVHAPSSRVAAVAAAPAAPPQAPAAPSRAATACRSTCSAASRWCSWPPRFWTSGGRAKVPDSTFARFLVANFGVPWTAAALILAGYWAAFALYPLPAPGFDMTTVGVAADWPHHRTGFAAHWAKNTIAMYVLVHVATDYVTRSFRIHFGRAPFEVFGAVYAPILYGAGALLVYWLILLRMYRNRVFEGI